MAVRICILCPGQGAQAVGMGRDFFAAFPAARQVYEQADRILGLGLADLCFYGPESRLNQTDMSQPAIYVTSVASYRAAEAVGFLSGADVVAFAGLSLGEYTALHLAGAFDFEQGLRLVAARGRFMQEAASVQPSGMVAIMGAEEETVRSLCQQCASGQVLVPANFNAPQQIVVSGHAEACQRLEQSANAAGYRAVPIRVAGAFHSPLMAPAAQRLQQELQNVTFRPLNRAVYSNVTALPHGDETSIRDLLVRQLTEPVRWQQTMERLLSQTDLHFIELAPGRILAGLARRIDRRVVVRSMDTAAALSGGNAAIRIKEKDLA